MSTDVHTYPFTAAQARAAADLAPTLQQRVLAALLVLPRGSALGGVSALQLLGLDVGPSEPLCFWTDHEHQVRRPGLRVIRVAELPPVVGDMLPGAALFRTAALDLGLLDLVAAGDFLLRQRQHCRSARQHPAAAPGVGDLVQLLDSGVAARTAVDGRLLGTPDLSYRRWRTVLEYEGDQHRSDPKQWSYDVRRYEWMAGADHTVIRITAQDWRTPRVLVNRVHTALVARGSRGPAPVFDDAWTELFESSAR